MGALIFRTKLKYLYLPVINEVSIKVKIHFRVRNIVFIVIMVHKRFPNSLEPFTDKISFFSEICRSIFMLLL